MSIIHMDTDEVLFILTSLENRSFDGRSQVEAMRKSLKSLAWSWFSTDTIPFNIEAAILVDKLNNQFGSLEDLCKRARNEVNEWVEVDAKLWKKIIPVGILDDKRDLLKLLSGGDMAGITLLTGMTGTGIAIRGGIMGSKVVPIIGDLISLVADSAEGVRDFLAWSVPDWERYETFGQEIAATLFNSVFYMVQQSIVLGVDVANLVTEVFNLVPGLGTAADIAIDLGCWAYNFAVDKNFEALMDFSNDWGIKDAFVKSISGSIDSYVTQMEGGFDPTAVQIMTAP